MSIGSRIFEKRRQLNMSQSRLAEAVGVSFQAISSWERGIPAGHTKADGDCQGARDNCRVPAG